jgi:hypothetical protein
MHLKASDLSPSDGAPSIQIIIIRCKVCKIFESTWPVRPVECERQVREIRRKIFGIARWMGQTRRSACGCASCVASASGARDDCSTQVFEKPSLYARCCGDADALIDRKSAGQRLRHVHEAFCHPVCRFGFSTNNPLISSLHPEREASGSLATRHDRLESSPLRSYYNIIEPHVPWHRAMITLCTN